ncbi:DUF554 domain-containing protein [Merdibacter massiliensis]|uniref:DUF554 domain-containing protein n=1 Tax=Merdibacter massiliensis TaxID=1871030 RepID=UPI0009FB09FD|nr:DUF554 domain-containing protein [Merdibacter massiliensis]
MDMFIGPLFNSAMVIIGTIAGIIFKKYLKPTAQDIVLKGLGFVTIYIAIGSILDSASGINVLISMSVGAFIGETFDLEKRFNQMGDWLQAKFGKGNSQFSDGFIEASLLFCMGSMGILGSLESGLMHTHNTLFSKGLLDGIASVFFSAKKGISVAFAGIVLFIYQGSLTALSSLLAPVLNDQCMAQINVVGGIILLSVAFNLLGIGKFKSMNYVPAIIVSVLLTLLFQI